MFGAFVGFFISSVFALTTYGLGLVLPLILLFHPLYLPCTKSTTLGGLAMGHIMVGAEPPFKKYGLVDYLYWWLISSLMTVPTLGIGAIWHVFYPCCSGDGYQFGVDYLCGHLVDKKDHMKSCSASIRLTMTPTPTTPTTPTTSTTPNSRRRHRQRQP